MTDLRLVQQQNAHLPMIVTDLENTMVSRDSNTLRNLFSTSVTPSATMRWTILQGISLALSGVNVNDTIVLMVD
jgi:hypothetical protein